MSEQSVCACGAAPKLIFACSGAADVGAVADQAARKMTWDGAGKMFCLAGIGGRVSGIMATTAAASKVLAIDGCPLNCVKLTLEQAGFTGFEEHLQLAELGMEKGQDADVAGGGREGGRGERGETGVREWNGGTLEHGDGGMMEKWNDGGGPVLSPPRFQYSIIPGFLAYFFLFRKRE